jgi:hypothetical protein
MAFGGWIGACTRFYPHSTPENRGIIRDFARCLLLILGWFRNLSLFHLNNPRAI